MATATWIKSELDQCGIVYDELHHLDAFTAQDMAHREHVTGHRVAKVVIVIADGRPVELILPASRRVDLDAAREVLGVDHVRLATEDEIAAYFTDCERGAIPAMRHWQGVPVWMDATMCVEGDIVFPAGTHRDAVRMRFHDWFRLVGPRLGRFSVPLGMVAGFRDPLEP
jgi:Ala-tRNA(Pro) deacylase